MLLFLNGLSRCARSHFLLFLLIIISLVAASSLASAESILRFSTTSNGAIAITGNTLGLSTAEDSNEPGTRGSIGTFMTVDAALRDTAPLPGTWPYGTTSDWTQNSSSGLLEMPKDTQVLYAELVWSGSYDYGTGSNRENVAAHLDTPITFTTPAGADHVVTPDPATAATLDEVAATGFNVHYYVRSADVTAIINEGGDGLYTVGGVPATQNHTTRELNAAGWSLVVVYSDSSEPMRNMTVFVAGEWVDEESVVDTLVEGFCAPPSGPVQGNLFVTALEGDAHYDGDQMLIAEPNADGTAPNSAFENVMGVNNPELNFFASQINDRYGALDTDGSFGNTNHDPGFDGSPSNILGGRQGVDITSVYLSSDDATLDNSQRRALIRATSTVNGDSYVVAGLAFEIAVNAPFFDVAGEPSTQSVSVGQLVSFDFELHNEGAADAESVTFYHPLPEHFQFVEGSFAVDGVYGDWDGSPVDATDLSNGVNVGPIEIGELAYVTFEARVASLPAPPEPAEIVTQASWDFEYHSCPSDPALTGTLYPPSQRFVASRISLANSVNKVLLAEPYERLTFTVDVSNDGTNPTSAAELSNAIPSNTAYVSGSTTLNGSSQADVNGTMPFSSTGLVNSPGAQSGMVAAGSYADVNFTVEVVYDASGFIRSLANFDEDGDGPASLISAEVVISINEDVDSDSASNWDEDIDGDGDLRDDDTDGDGLANYVDDDDDGDSILTVREDLNSDGDPSNDDLDRDGLPNFLDADDDGDGTPTVSDNCPLTNNPDQADSDGDGVGNTCQNDGDGDGIDDLLDNCPADYNPTQTNSDLTGDGGDACDDDDDNDMLGDASDNCPAVANPGQENLDGDLYGDACDPDIDGDDLANNDETTHGTNPRVADTDQDGLSDGVEVLGQTHTDPTDPDTDGDELCDGPASIVGTCRAGEDIDADGRVGTTETSPANPDTDGGGAWDGSELDAGTDPLDPTDDIVTDIDRDGDGLTDLMEVEIGTNPDDADTDNDGLSDGLEVDGDTGTNPLDPDTDSDTLCDGPETVDGDCEAGEDLNANGIVDPGETDPTNPDSDGDGVLDGDELRDGTDPLDPNDHLGDRVSPFDGPQACACNSPGQQNVSIIALLLMVAMVVYRRRHFQNRDGASTR